MEEITVQLAGSDQSYLKNIFRIQLCIHVQGLRFEVFSLFSPSRVEYYSRTFRSHHNIQDARDVSRWRQADDGMCTLDESSANLVVEG